MPNEEILYPLFMHEKLRPDTFWRPHKYVAMLQYSEAVISMSVITEHS